MTQAKKVQTLAAQIAFSAKDVQFLAEEGDRDAATAKRIRTLAAEIAEAATHLQGILEEAEAEAAGAVNDESKEVI